MIEDVAKLSGVQEVIFKHIPITLFEKGRLLEEEANAKKKKKKNLMSSSNEGEEQVNEDNCAEHAPSMEEMGWSMVGDDSRQVNYSSSSLSSSSQADEEEEVGAVSRKEFEMLKDEKEDQDELNSCLVYQNAQLQETIDLLCLLLQKHGIDSSELMEKKLDRRNSGVRRRSDREQHEKDEGFVQLNMKGMVEEEEENEEENGGDDIHATVQELMRGAVVTAAVYVVLLSLLRRSPNMRNSTKEFAKSAAFSIRHAFRFAYGHGK